MDPKPESKEDIQKLKHKYCGFCGRELERRFVQQGFNTSTGKPLCKRWSQCVQIRNNTDGIPERHSSFLNTSYD